MKFLKTNIEGCFVIEPNLMEDNRGGFFRSFCKEEFHEHVGAVDFAQMNHSINLKKGTFRGLHYQQPPYAEEKLIRCVKGKLIDFFLDIREGSPTFLKYGKIELSTANRKMIYICKGIAHGFITLENNTELLYHHTEKYNKEADRGIRYNDPKVMLKLPIEISVVSDKDLNYPLLTEEFKGIVI